MDHGKKIEFNDYEVLNLLEAPEDLLYKLAMEMNRFKSIPMKPERLKIDKKQKLLKSATSYFTSGTLTLL